MYSDSKEWYLDAYISPRRPEKKGVSRTWRSRIRRFGMKRFGEKRFRILRVNTTSGSGQESESPIKK